MYVGKRRDILDAVIRTSRCDECNLILKALAYLRRALGDEGAFSYPCWKNGFPMQAGLAGGSADAGAMIRAAQRCARSASRLRQVAEAAKCVGADVPYCVMNRCARVEGIGEKLTFLQDHCDFQLLLVKPPCGVSTGKAYQLLDLQQAEHPDIDLVERCLLADDYETLCRSLGNTLEYSAFQMEPQVRTLQEMLAEEGADAALMSGSGSAVFALSRDIAVLERLRQKAEALGCLTAG
ncbi:MAG: 4-(cytidine 5'-diphospho)-2-C-methyl-D-erythritol kinase [Merdibacter sp.]